jgi:pyruvate,water dikinase
MSFAGQYLSLLGVPFDRVEPAYKQVVASLYSPNAMRYRASSGLDPARGLMAVGCLCMVKARASGVVYTLDPSEPERGVVVVSAALGLGKTVVEGAAAVDRFEISRTRPHTVLSCALAAKQKMFDLDPVCGIQEVPVPQGQQGLAAVTDETLCELAETALAIERYMKCAQDIEWAVDSEGQLHILQARPLRLNRSERASRLRPGDVADAHRVLMEGRGEVACRGVGVGRVHPLSADDDVDRLPQDTVLVARSASPKLSAAIPRASAVITDVGTTTGHLAAIAREFRVPTIVDTGNATGLLAGGQEVTVDAEENVVYEGRVDALMHDALLNSTPYAEKPEFRLLRKMLNKVAPLNLKDPQSAEFTAAGCTTYHDIIRFAHEKAVDAFTRGSWVRPGSDSAYIRPLALDIPLDLILIDLGGGFRVRGEAKTVAVADVTSRPLASLLRGLTTQGAWPTGPAAMDLDGFMSSAIRSPVVDGALASRPEQNLAIVSGEYMHLSLRLGYHFNIVDCYLTETRNDNYIYFRFLGGVTEMTRRSRRASLLKSILERQDFVVEGSGDLVIARIKKLPAEAMDEQLSTIGRLIGFTRQLDIMLVDDETVERCIQGFLQGNYSPFRDADTSALERRDEMPGRTEVLVLDDEAVVCERLKEHLENSGMRVETFTESFKALERLNEKRFDVVITDLKMEGPTGLDVLHAVRRHTPSTQVIIITGYATMEAAREAEFTGVYDFVTKPFRMSAIGAMAKKAASKARRQQRRARK